MAGRTLTQVNAKSLLWKIHPPQEVLEAGVGGYLPPSTAFSQFTTMLIFDWGTGSACFTTRRRQYEKFGVKVVAEEEVLGTVARVYRLFGVAPVLLRRVHKQPARR